ncbi:MAG: hypothetical protein ACM30H_08810 [Clostridia bacterium]
MNERTKAWQCIGCGRLESQATCVGICSDRPVEIVSAAAYDELAAQAEALRAELRQLRLFVRQLALVSPHAGDWERVYKSLQDAAMRVLERQGA